MNIYEQAFHQGFDELTDNQKVACINALYEMQNYSWFTPFLYQYDIRHKMTPQVEGQVYLKLKTMILKSQLYLRFFNFHSWAVADRSIKQFDNYSDDDISIKIYESRASDEDGCLTLNKDTKSLQVIFDDSVDDVNDMKSIIINEGVSIPFEIGTTTIVKTFYQLKINGYLARLPYQFDEKLNPMIAIISEVKI